MIRSSGDTVSTARPLKAGATIDANAAAGSLHSLRAALERALEARKRVRARCSNRHLIEVLAAAAEPWQDRESPERTSVTPRLAEALRLDPGMLVHGLDFVFAALGRAQLETLLAEAEDPGALEPASAPAGVARRRLGGPAITFHSFAGNVPGLAIPAIAASALARSVAVMRDSARHPDLTEAFVATLSRHDADVAAMMVPTRWRAGDADCEREILGVAERADLYGSDTTLRAIRARNPTSAAAIVEHGTRVSTAFVPACTALERPEVLDRLADGLALDVCMYDGLGCLTPHAVVVSGVGRAQMLAERLAASMEASARLWPRRLRTFAAECARRAFVGRCEAAAATDASQALWRGESDAWVLHLAHAGFDLAGPGLRLARVIAVASDDEALALLSASAIPLAAVGLALSRSDPGYEAMARRLRACGATLVCEAGRMQAPPLTWTDGDRRRLGDTLRWQSEPS